jgi:hypothetical protein
MEGEGRGREELEERGEREKIGEVVSTFTILFLSHIIPIAFS